MDYQQFCQYQKKDLPINRNESFYFGTVLPILLLQNGRDNFFTFLSLIHGFPADINSARTGDHFHLYTGYDLHKAQDREHDKEYYHRDPLDMVVEILQPHRLLVVVEAAMFHNLPIEYLHKRVRRHQEDLGHTMDQRYLLKTKDIFFLALVPGQSLAAPHSSPRLQVLHWETLLEKFSHLDDCHFAHYLRYALENYPQLVSQKDFTPAGGAEFKMRGQAIYQDRAAKDEHWLCRKGGESQVIDDIKDGSWHSRDYGINTTRPAKGKRSFWIPVSRFCELVVSYSQKN